MRPHPALAVAVLALGLTVALPASAQRPDNPLGVPLSADLDGDGSAETIRANVITCNEGAHDPPCLLSERSTVEVEVLDNCYGSIQSIRLSREADSVTVAQVIDANSDGVARELAYETRNGREVQAKVVLFRAGINGCVQVRKTVFSYPNEDTVGKRPKGARRTIPGGFAVGDYSRRPGLELRTLDAYLRRGDRVASPTWVRTTYWTYYRSRGDFRPFRTQVRRVKRG